MQYLDLYRQCLESIPAKIRKSYDEGMRSALGYTSDLDVLIRWDVNTFNEMVDKYLNAEPSFRIGDVLNSASDFVCVVCHLVLNGIGGEIEIKSKDVCTELTNRFDCVYALGGTCAQGSAALACVGIPVLMQISDRSEAVCKFLNYPEISMVSPEGKTVPVMEMISGREPVNHFILQYEKGDVVRIGLTEHVIPLSNRLIMDYDDLHKTLPVDPVALAYLEAHAQDIPSYNISGFNSIMSPEVLRHTVVKMSAHYARMKQANPACILYLESAHYLNPQSRETVYKGFAPFLDILGMNEEELSDLANANGQGLVVQNLTSLLSTLEMIHETYPAKGLVIHSKDYAVYYGWPHRGIDMEKALCCGNLLSGTRACVGHYGSIQDCEGTLALPLSAVGLELAKNMPSEHKGRMVCIVPSRYMENPLSTIGLGDTFVAGMQIAFI